MNKTNEDKLLIVEDDEFLRGMIVKKLETSGFDIIVAVSGEEALEKTAKEKPTLVLLDVLLPDISGFEVLKSLKADKNTSSIPVIILSNLGQEDEIKKGLSLGASDYWVKAYLSPEVVIGKVNKFLSKNKEK